MHKLKFYLFTLLAISFLWTGCEDDEAIDMEAPRLFRPTSFEASVNGVNARLSWRGIPGAESYTVEVSRDSLDYSSPDFSETTVERSVLLTDLQGGSRYYARLKANSSDSDISGSLFAEIVIDVPEENLFSGFSGLIGVIAEKTVKVFWQAGNNVTHLTFSNGTDDVQVDITELEAETGSKTDIVLPSNNTNYTVLLMNNETTRGVINIKVEGDVFVGAGDNIVDAIAGAVNGNVIVLEGNNTFVHEGTWSIEAGKSLTIKGGPGSKKAILAFNNITNSTAIGQPVDGVEYLKFDNIELTGALNGDMESTSVNWAPHLINLNADGEITKLFFENCIISKFNRNIVRYRSTSRMDSLIISNSIVDFTGGSGDYALVVTENDSYITDLLFVNSTFYGSKRGLIRNNSNVETNSFVMDHCTVNEFVDENRYLIEMKSPIVRIELKNSILGSTVSQYNPISASGGIYGISEVEGYSISTSGTYALADFSQNIGFPNRMIDFQSYSKPSSDVFLNPTEYDFRIKDSGFGGRGIAGDPRWY